MTSEALRKILVAGAMLAALSFGAAVHAQPVTPPVLANMTAQDLVQDLPGGTVYPTNYYVTDQQMKSWVLGQNSQHLTAPTPTITTTICGGSTGTVVGTDVAGQITEGSSASTSCVLTFAKAFVTAPACFVSINNVTDSSLKCATSTTVLTITKSSNASELINYLVVGLPGG